MQTVLSSHLISWLRPKQAKAASWKRLSLPERELVKIRVAAGGVIRCRSGKIWLTSDRGGGDFVLVSGERFSPAVGSVLLVEALGGAAEIEHGAWMIRE